MRRPGPAGASALLPVAVAVAVTNVDSSKRSAAVKPRIPIMIPVIPSPCLSTASIGHRAGREFDATVERPVLGRVVGRNGLRRAVADRGDLGGRNAGGP